MGRITLTLLFLGSYILTVTPLDLGDVGRATDYFEKQIFKGYKKQYAYFVKFTPAECIDGLQVSDFKKVMKETDPKILMSKLKNKNEIYEGDRMVAAAPLDRTLPNNHIITEHSEFRLLNPDNNSPVSRLMNKNPIGGCVIFFSLNSPCVQTCTSINGPYNIVSKLNRVPRLPNNQKDRAFAYRKVFRYDQEKDEKIVWKHWAHLNTAIDLYRCTGNNCIKCFDNEKQNRKCYTG